MSGSLVVPTLAVPGLDDDVLVVLNACLAQLTDKAIINDRRSKMFEGKYSARHLGISVPPQLERVETTLMWPAKAVEALEALVNLEGFVVPDGTAADFGIDRIWRDNRLGIEATQAHTSSLKYGVSFLAVMAGGEGEPEVVIRNLSATSSTAIWDANKRRASAALSITASKNGLPTEFILYLEDRIVTCSSSDGEWSTVTVPHSLGRCPVAVLPFKPSVEEPFGRSRITRGVMTITERVARTLLRMEISAEFYSAPQRWLMGADDSVFENADGTQRSGWSVQIGKMLAVGPDDEGKVPTTGQYQQLTMQPHMDMVRSDAALFAGETNIPVSALGIIHDNPASDAAMQSAYMALYGEAERAQVPWDAGWVDAMLMAVEIRDGKDVADSLAGLKAKWGRVDAPTMAARGDFVAKQISAFPWMVDSDVALEESGYDQTTIERLRADRRRGGVGSLVANLAANAQAAVADPEVAALAVTRGDGNADQ